MWEQQFFSPLNQSPNQRTETKSQQRCWLGNTEIPMQDTVVTHCLAVWHTHTGNMHQSDKDFFDAHVVDILQSITDPFIATQELITVRLHEFGHSYDEAIGLAQNLVSQYAKRWGVVPAQLIKN
jgi:hypothetical protein